ncbi:MAG: phosphate transport system substrate-binding protein [Planctomycetaceae bacterium]|jgi:phosphate transport system substrate-binding protein
MKIIYSLLIAFLLTACGGEQNDASNVSADGSPLLKGSVRLDGSSTVFPISEAVAEEYLAVQRKVRVTVGVSGTGGGFKKFINQEIDINAASRPIKESEVEKATAAGIGFIEIPVAFDGLSVVVNSKNDWVDHLTVQELNRIWQPDSVVETWKDVRPEWPDEKIRLYGPGTDSGTFDYFTGTINGKEQASRPDFTASEDDNVLVQGISGDHYSLGYFGFAYYKENADKLRIVPIDGGVGPIEPTEVTINNGTYAPLSRPIFIYLNAASLDKPQVADFVDFYLDNAASLATEVGYINLPASVYEKAKARVANREEGSSFHGTATSLTEG